MDIPPEMLKWASDACHMAGITGGYSFELVPCLKDWTGKPLSGCVTTEGQILLNSEWRGSKNNFTATYLHEVGHVIALNARIDDPAGGFHNKYFAALVATMYRRANLLDRLKLYDFADECSPGVEEGMAGDSELIRRFEYIISRSAQLARSRLSIEAAAEWIFWKDCFPEWNRKVDQDRSTSSSWWAFWRW